MHSSQNRFKRKRGKNVSNDDDTAMAVSRADDEQTDAYGRSRPQTYQQHTDTYIPSSSRSTSIYTMNRDGPSSHTSTQEHFHPHAASDGHYRAGRDSYDIADSRDGDQRRRYSHDGDFHGSGRERTSRDIVQGYSAAHRNESQGWGPLDNPEDGPQWGSPSSDWKRGELEDDRSKGGWDNSRNREHRSQGNRRWQSDNGWESRKRERHQNRRPPDSQDDGPFSKEDRTWEPGPGWHPRGEQTYRNQRGRGGGKIKGKKNIQNRQRQRGDKDRDHDRRWDRDRRNDNDNLNKYAASFCFILGYPKRSSSWQRREFHPLPPKPVRSPVKRPSSPSRSRSRTPDSVYSRQSSRGRSRSRSFSPQPDVRHSSPAQPRSRTPPRRVKGSRSPPSHRSYMARAPPRGRSVSSMSSGSWSRSRSSSRSPGDRPRAKHRLPPATSIRDISISISKPAVQQRPNFVLDQEPESTRNEKASANGNHHTVRPFTVSTRFGAHILSGCRFRIPWIRTSVKRTYASSRYTSDIRFPPSRDSHNAISHPTTMWRRIS